jgi:two-component system OmpR family response regulator
MHLLLIEDELTLARLIADGLTAEGFAIDHAANGEAALERATNTTYDLAILDVMLPGMDGFAVCRALRAQGFDAPILMLSARGVVEDRVKGLELGADDYLTKPFASSELSARVRALLRRRYGAIAHRLEVGTLALDPVSRIAHRGERRLDLTQKEWALLEYLMRHAGQPVTRGMIAEQVWNTAWHGLTNAIDVYVTRLRRKVDAAGEPRLIHAVRGVGYTIRVGQDD